MNESHLLETVPKPFVFVLMPFDAAFDDIYKFGIKGAAEDVGAYAERIDEQYFDSGVLDRTYNQINKADVIVADMTGKNANVFYEVGYAHALGKIVLLLTQRTDDIPFNLKHHQHTVYGGAIDRLRKELAQRLQWAITAAREREQGGEVERFVVSCDGRVLPELPSSVEPPTLLLQGNPGSIRVPVTFAIRNVSKGPTHPIPYLYVLAESSASDTVLVPHTDVYTYTGGSSTRYKKSRELDSGDPGFPIQFRLAQQLPAMPPGAVEEVQIKFGARSIHDTSLPGSGTKSRFILRLHGIEHVYDFAFALEVSIR